MKDCREIKTFKREQGEICNECANFENCVQDKKDGYKIFYFPKRKNCFITKDVIEHISEGGVKTLEPDFSIEEE